MSDEKYIQSLRQNFQNQYNPESINGPVSEEVKLLRLIHKELVRISHALENNHKED